MSGNSFGERFSFTTFGESHGPAVGVVIDGLPAGLKIDLDFIQRELDRRRPGQSEITTQRQEEDKLMLLSGVFEGISTGCPLTLVVKNRDQRSGDYSTLAKIFRPGHADYTYQQKFGIRDYRGGGRSSGRETIARVAAGAVAKLLLMRYGVLIRACAVEIAKVKCKEFDWSAVEENVCRAPDRAAAERMKRAIKVAQEEGDSVGGVIFCRAEGVPAGLGEPAFDKLDAKLAQAMLSIGGVKGIEFGDGFGAARLRGSENNDELTLSGYASNHAGGMLGGISNGAPVEFRVAVKPTPSIGAKQHSITTDGNPVKFEIHGRHDPCLVPRVVPVVEAMTALVLADLALRRQTDRVN